METSIRSKVILPHHCKAPKAAFRSLRSRVAGINVVDVFNVSGRPASVRPILILHPTNLNQPANPEKMAWNVDPITRCRFSIQNQDVLQDSEQGALHRRPRFPADSDSTDRFAVVVGRRGQRSMRPFLDRFKKN